MKKKTFLFVSLDKAVLQNTLEFLFNVKNNFLENYGRYGEYCFIYENSIKRYLALF